MSLPFGVTNAVTTKPGMKRVIDLHTLRQEVNLELTVGSSTAITELCLDSICSSGAYKYDESRSVLPVIIFTDWKVRVFAYS